MRKGPDCDYDQVELCAACRNLTVLVKLSLQEYVCNGNIYSNNILSWIQTYLFNIFAKCVRDVMFALIRIVLYFFIYFFLEAHEALSKFSSSITTDIKNWKWHTCRCERISLANDCTSFCDAIMLCTGSICYIWQILLGVTLSANIRLLYCVNLLSSN